MPEAKFISWTHGSGMQAEYPNRLTSVRHTGPFARIEGSPGQNTWVHFPVPTPTVVDGETVKVGAVLVSFRTRPHATVDEVVLYDGERRIAEHLALEMQGDHLDARFNVPGSPEAERGMNVAIGVTFADDAPNVRSMQIEIIGVGIEFL